ncbi:lysophospholipase 1 [[Candida] jaroonii]|uniref:Lysophospholipase 1 n=1 Tax=[Candida] jaroonii TaxID=467808 RepID=A0ACA9Y8F5_9ASCO|nr:lysophospholipase 1 [[Candida] jaroonii]
MMKIIVLAWFFVNCWAITWPWQDKERNPYVPYYTDCPSGPLLREAKGVNDDEKKYITKRYEKTNVNLIDFLENVAKLKDFNASDFINDYSEEHNISIGLAFSGGGYRAMLSGAGQLLALDSRFSDANDNALGGILQSSSYITGLSGGSWIIGSTILNNWTSISDIIDGKTDIWHLDDSIFNPNGINIIKTGQYYTDIGTAINDKDDAGFPVSLTDIWGRAISNQFLPGDDSGANVTWSSIRELDDFKDHNIPFPIILANGRYEFTRIVDLNSTVFEMTPYEVGSWDPTLKSFVDTKYLGTYLDNGEANSTNSCVVNFDNAGFIMGTSSSIFNQFLTRLDDYGVPTYLQGIVKRILESIGSNENDIAVYEPNPFYNSEYSDSSLKETHSLHLVDGGEDQQNIPLYPLIQSSRDVDVIFAFDNSGDTESNWPNGSSVIHTFTRQFSSQGKGAPVPFVPMLVDEVLKKGYNERPLFFGCNADDLDDLVTLAENKDLNSTDVPLIIHIPNSFKSYESNISTFTLDFDDDERDGIIQNGYETASQNNLTDDQSWSTCVGCAIIRRSQERLGVEQTEECKKCFKDYCYFPDKDADWMKAIADSASKINDGSSSSESNSESSSESSLESSSESSSESESKTSSKTGSGNSNQSTLSSSIQTSSTSSESSPESSSSSSDDSASTLRMSLLIMLLWLI